MEYKEIHRDVFTVKKDYFLAHCISSDASMTAGIAVDFKKKFKLASLQKQAKASPLPVGSCILVDRVLNLITKRVFHGLPTYETFTAAIVDMKRVALENDIKKIAMPRIGADLDKLSWGRNREIIQEIFADTDIEILVCRFR
jgi:O-acetyl-ADP-ribose deacetylase (regulator of RNase III)